MLCDECGKYAKKVITPTYLGSCWPEGKTFEHVADGNQVFRNYRELDQYAAQNGGSVEAPTPAQIKLRQEERRHKMLNRGKIVPKKLKVPEKVERAFRECPTVDAAVKALKEERV